MTALTLDQEFGLMRLRFQRTLAISIGVHVLFFAWLMIDRHLAPADEAVVEITWLEQQVLPIPEPTIIEPVVTKTEPEPVIDAIKPTLSVKEKLASNAAHAQQVRDKLNALKPSSVADKALSALPASSADLLNSAQATMAPITRREPPANLNRGPGPKQQAVALTRGPTTSHKTAAVVAEIPNQAASVAAAKPGAESNAVRNLGGATLKGLIADRRVIAHTMPTYPGWATTQAVEASVTLYFLVMPNGEVRENVQVQKTAGFQDFDNNAVTAIRQWRFAPLTGNDAREQWGTITFRYRLND